MKKDINNIHDKGYKDLYSSKDVFSNLVKDTLNFPWAKEIKPSDLILVDKSYILPADKEEVVNVVANNSNIIKEMEERAEKKGKAEILIKQLVRKFSEVPIKYQDDINKLSEETIEQIALDIFDINTLSDLDKYFN